MFIMLLLLSYFTAHFIIIIIIIIFLLIPFSFSFFFFFSRFCARNIFCAFYHRDCCFCDDNFSFRTADSFNCQPSNTWDAFKIIYSFVVWSIKKSFCMILNPFFLISLWFCHSWSSNSLYVTINNFSYETENLIFILIRLCKNCILIWFDKMLVLGKEMVLQ